MTAQTSCQAGCIDHHLVCNVVLIRCCLFPFFSFGTRYADLATVGATNSSTNAGTHMHKSLGTGPNERTLTSEQHMLQLQRPRFCLRPHPIQVCLIVPNSNSMMHGAGRSMVTSYGIPPLLATTTTRRTSRNNGAPIS
jgi:hypothetical protein